MEGDSKYTKLPPQTAPLQAVRDHARDDLKRPQMASTMDMNYNKQNSNYFVWGDSQNFKPFSVSYSS